MTAVSLATTAPAIASPRDGASPATRLAEESLEQLTSRWNKQLPFWQRPLLNILSAKESTRGISHLKFAQDTGTVWAPKFLTARSWAERFEVSFVEIIESFFFYYASPVLSQKLSPFFHKLSPLKDKIKKADLLKPVENLTEEELKRVGPIKLATILSGLGMVIAAGNYGLNFVKNIITDKGFKTSNFDEIANLKQDKKRDKELETKVLGKAGRRMFQSLLISGGIFATSSLIALAGHKLTNVPPLMKGMRSFLKTFDFNYSPDGKFGLGKTHAALIIFGAACSYFDAARSKLEFNEVLRRVPITAGYLMVGNEILQNFVLKGMRRFFPKVTNGVMEQKGTSIKKLVDLNKQVIEQAKTLLEKEGKEVTKEALEARAKELFKPIITKKGALFMAPLLAGMGLVGFAVTKINQKVTAYSYQKKLEEKAAQNQTQQQAENPIQGSTSLPSPPQPERPTVAPPVPADWRPPGMSQPTSLAGPTPYPAIARRFSLPAAPPVVQPASVSRQLPLVNNSAVPISPFVSQQAMMIRLLSASEQQQRPAYPEFNPQQLNRAYQEKNAKIPLS